MFIVIGLLVPVIPICSPARCSSVGSTGPDTEAEREQFAGTLETSGVLGRSFRPGLRGDDGCSGRGSVNDLAPRS